MRSSRRNAEHQLAAIRSARRNLANAPANLPYKDLPVPVGRVLSEDCERTLWPGRKMARQLQHLRKRPRFKGELPHRQAARRQGAHQYLQDLQPAARLSVRYENVYGAKERTIHHFGL